MPSTCMYESFLREGENKSSWSISRISKTFIHFVIEIKGKSIAETPRSPAQAPPCGRHAVVGTAWRLATAVGARETAVF